MSSAALARRVRRWLCEASHFRLSISLLREASLMLYTGMLLFRSRNPLLFSTRLRSPLLKQVGGRSYVSSHRTTSIVGTTTPIPEDVQTPDSKSPFYFDTGYALFAKRPSRPFPPPFLSKPSESFSDPLTTHDRSRDRRSYVNGEMIRGVTNGDDAVLVSENFIGANDGVGAWSTRENGHAA